MQKYAEPPLMLLNDTHKGYVTSKEKKPRLNPKPTRPRPNESESGEMLAKRIVSPNLGFGSRIPVLDLSFVTHSTKKLTKMPF